MFVRIRRCSGPSSGVSRVRSSAFRRQRSKSRTNDRLKAELQTRISLERVGVPRSDAAVTKTVLFFYLSLVLVVSGCTTKSNANAQARAAFLMGQQQALAQQQQGPVVTVVGQVKNRTVPWTEDLTLTKALIAAEYQGFSDPRAITIIRNGQQYQVNVKQLLKGREDPPLEPGDTIEVRQ